MKRSILLSLLIISIVSFGFGQKKASQKIETKVAAFFDISAPLTEMIGKSKNFTQLDPFGHKLNKNIFPEKPKKGNGINKVDPLVELQRSYSAPKAETLVMNSSFDGSVGTGASAPPDTDGDVSPNHYVQMINNVTQIFDKNGNVVTAQFNSSDFWVGFSDGSGGDFGDTNDGDPIVLWDESAGASGRWIVTQFAVPHTDGKYYELIAISQTSDPTGSYYRYAFEYPNMNDYPKFAIWPDAYYCGFNAFDMSTNPATSLGVYVSAYERDEMIAGNPAAKVVTITDANLFAVFPADADVLPPLGTPGIFINDMVQTYSGNDEVYIYEFDVDWANTANSTFVLSQTITVTPYGFFGGTNGNGETQAEQSSNAQKLDLLHYRTMYRSYYRPFAGHNSLVMCRTVDPNNDGLDTDEAGIRWYEFRNVGVGAWNLYQEGTYAPGDGLWRWMPSIAMNGNGDIAIAYSISGTAKDPAIAGVARYSTDPLNVMTTNEMEFFAGNTAQSGVSRWGDYSMLSVDPSDDYSFWFTTEYSNGGWNWATRIIHFELPVTCTPPTSQATNLSFSGITNNSITANWTQGNGDADLVVVREGSAVDQDPTPGTTYPANSVFPSGTQIGIGNYAVYDGSAGTITVTGLNSGATYYFAIYTYNSVDHCYLLTELTGNATTVGPPSVTTDVTTAITGSSATSGGNVTSNNGSAVTVRGVCWKTIGTPTTADSKTTDGAGTGTFTSSLTGLSTTTTYHVRAYATNSYGTSYGNEEVFTTLCGIFSLPFTEDFASGTLPSCWENIDNDGGGQIWEFNNPGGVTVNTTTSANGFAILDSDNYGNGNSQDADLITPTLDLTGFTGVNLSFEHYFRSYSGSSAELFYSIDGGNTWTSIQSWNADTGNPETFSQAIAAVDGQSNVKFKWNYTGSYGWYWAIDDINITGTAAGTAPTVTTQAVTSISCTTATGNGNITNLGSPNPTAHGVCWNTTGTPTTSDSFTDEGAASATGAFTSAMTGLTANTTYYVRAYATNTAGTSYGTEVNFTTDPNLAVSVSIAADANPICDGTSVTFTATPTNGGTPSYQWKLNGTNVGSNSLTYTNATLTNGDDVTCVMTSDLSCTTGNPATSNTVTMTVNPILPVSVSIAADANPVCAGTSVTFTATPTNGGTPAYQWKLNGTNVGTNSATYTNGGLVNGDAITCVLTSSETCTSGNPATSNDVTMTVNPQPVAPTSVSASPTPVSSGGTSTLSYSGGSGDTFEWYTGSCGGTGIGSGNNLDVTNITSTTTYYGRWENGCGVSSCQQVTVTVTGATTYTISGTVKYDDASTTAVNGETIELYDGATLKDTKITDASGAYAFTNVADGTYTVKPAGNLAWGGATAMDVTLYKMHLLGVPEPQLAGLKLASGDVNASGSLTTADLTTDLQRIVTTVSSFLAGDWAYTDGTVTVSGANQTVNLSAICYGDANTSRFGAKSLNTINVQNNSVIYVEDGDYFEMQINLQNNITDLSSVTLNIPFDANKFEIINVSMENNNSNMYYNVENGVLRIAYSSLNLNNYVQGDKFLKITGFVNNITEETNISNNITGEFGDYNSNVLNSITFAMPSFSPKANSVSEISKNIYIYPNPANNFLNILNAENSKVEVLNILGSKVLITQNIDKYNNRINTQNLATGTYILKVNKNNKVIMKKFTIIK